jgi:hypothetical protein
MHLKENKFQTPRAPPFPKIDRHACFIVKDANCPAVSYACLESETGRRVAAGKRISKRVSSCMPYSLRLGYCSSGRRACDARLAPFGRGLDRAADWVQNLGVRPL